MKRYVSDYAMNLKNKTAIVCPSFCGPNIFLTAEHFKDDQEFSFWKTVSDEDYRLRDSAERREKANTVLLDDHPQLFPQRTVRRLCSLRDTKLRKCTRSFIKQ